MRYKIVLKAITNKKLLKLLSEKIAEKEHKPQIQIIRELAQGGFVYASELHKTEAAQTAQKLTKLHIEFAIIKDEEHHNKVFIPKDTSGESEAPVKKIHPVEVAESLPLPPPNEHKPKLHTEHDAHHEANLRALYGLDQAPPKKEKTPPIIIIRNLAIVLLIFGLLWFVSSRSSAPSTKPTKGKMSAKAKSSSSTAENQKANKGQKSSKSKKNNSKETNSTQNKNSEEIKDPQSAEEVEELTDEAKDVCGNDGDQATKMYRVAISFNKKNIHAWNGLLNCFKQHGLNKEAMDTEKEMKKIFGDDIFSVQKIVSSYGDLEEFSERSGITNLRYLSDRSDPEIVIEDVYKMGLRLSTSLKSKKISVYATTTGNKGVLITFAGKPYPQSLRAFKAKANIDIIE